MTKLYKVRPLPCKAKKVWTNTDRQEMTEYATLEFPRLKKSDIADVVRNMEKLGITLEESVNLVEFDKNPQDLAISVENVKKVEKKMTAEAKKALKAEKSRKKEKADEVKSLITDNIVELLENLGQNKPKIVGTGTVCFVGSDGSYYTLKLTKNKSCPGGYTED